MGSESVNYKRRYPACPPHLLSPSPLAEKVPQRRHCMLEGVLDAAELHNATRELVSFSLDNIDPDKHIRLHLIEASPRILPALPERIPIAVRR